MCAALHAHVCVWLGAHVSAPLAPSTLAFVGSQAFYQAYAFNADISKWNTARVTNMTAVCATFGRRRATAADALGLTD